MNKIGINIAPESKEHTLDYPTKKDPGSFIIERSFESHSTTATLNIIKDGDGNLVFLFKRGRYFSDTKAHPLMTDIGSRNSRLISARQMIESFLAVTGDYMTSDSYNLDEIYMDKVPGFSDIPVLALQARQQVYSRYPSWEDSPYLELRE